MNVCFGLDLKTKTENSLRNTKVLEILVGWGPLHLEDCLINRKIPMVSGKPETDRKLPGYWEYGFLP